MNTDRSRPLVYACSGASSAAQMANHLAVRMDRLEVAEMSCIVGVGGDVQPLVAVAKSGRPIIALDGCPLRCAAKTLQRHNVRADLRVDLSELGVRKRQHEDFDPQQAVRVLQQLLNAPDFPGGGTPRSPAASGAVAPRESVAASPQGEEPLENFSSPCYLSEFRTVNGVEP